jgi:hypothetical protein
LGAGLLVSSVQELIIMFARTFIPLLGAVAVTAALTGCSSPTAPSPELEGGVVVTFETSGETFRVFVASASTIGQLFALERGEATASIPNGRILRGAGPGNHNAPYGWHLDPADVAMADVTIELCDGRPSYVQANLDEYVDVVGRYCPWGATLVSIQDYR